MIPWCWKWCVHFNNWSNCSKLSVFGHSAQNILSKKPASYFWSRFGEKGNHGNGDEEQTETGKLRKPQMPKYDKEMCLSPYKHTVMQHSKKV